MPKVLHIGPCDSPGGMANVMKILAEHPPEGWEAELLASHVVGSPWAKWRAYRKARSTLIRTLNDPTQRPDVVHLHTAADWSWWRKRRFALLAHAAGCKIVVHIHSGKFDQWLGSSSSKRAQSVTSLLLRLGTITVVLNEYWKSQLEPRVGMVHVINNPVSPQIKASDIQRDTSHVLLLGRNDPVKGHKFAMQICEQVRESVPDLQVTMSGIRSSSLNWISCVGWVSELEKLRLLQSASLLLVPSEFEGQPLVIHEALTCGLQVLASDQVYCVPESVVQASLQSKSDWVAKVSHMLDNPTPPSILMEEAASHSVQNISKKWLNLYSVMQLEHE
ncbi:glycosyltransferase family 4 protein [Candidatus Poseidoniales archaeon]|nr:glycosyltransferase family 4 protein [Candidatus Poseidoniales archaeon]